MFANLIEGSQIKRLSVLQTEGTHYMENNTALIFDSGRNFTKKCVKDNILDIRRVKESEQIYLFL